MGKRKAEKRLGEGKVKGSGKKVDSKEEERGRREKLEKGEGRRRPREKEGRSSRNNELLLKMAKGFLWQFSSQPNRFSTAFCISENVPWYPKRVKKNRKVENDASYCLGWRLGPSLVAPSLVQRGSVLCGSWPDVHCSCWCTVDYIATWRHRKDLLPGDALL
jgi:hypothetical protein